MSYTKLQSGINDLATTHPDLLKEWDYEKNSALGLEPTTVSKGSKKKVWWKCKNEHQWEATIISRTNNKRECPYCSGRKLLEGYNDLATVYPELIREWDYEQNAGYNLEPTSLLYTSRKKIWWKCSEGHSWTDSIESRLKYSNCPFCNKIRIQNLISRRKNILSRSFDEENIFDEFEPELKADETLSLPDNNTELNTDTENISSEQTEAEYDLESTIIDEDYYNIINNYTENKDFEYDTENELIDEVYYNDNLIEKVTDNIITSEDTKTNQTIKEGIPVSVHEELLSGYNKLFSHYKELLSKYNELQLRYDNLLYNSETPFETDAVSGEIIDETGENSLFDITKYNAVNIADLVSLKSYLLQDRSLKNNPDILILPDDIETISVSDAIRFKNLKELYLPANLKTLNPDIFEGCDNLKKLVIPKNLFLSLGENPYVPVIKNLENTIFYIARILPNLETLTVSDSNINLLNSNEIKEIEVSEFNANIRFKRFENLERVIIKDNIRRIPAFAFCGCHNLKEIRISENLEEIGGNAFAGCHELKEINLPNSAKSIGEGCFRNLFSLENITLSDKLTQIPYRTFENCQLLKTITIPDSVNFIGSKAFAECNSLKEITIPDGVEEIYDYSFFHCTNLEKVHLPASLKIIGKNAFSKCLNLHEITIPDGTEYIDTCAFSLCSNLNVYAPDTVTIHEKAFYKCSDTYILKK